jgi:hypothetical protein
VTERWPFDETLQAARDEWLKHGAITSGFRGVCVTHVENELMLTFQWMKDPNTYAIRFPLPGMPKDFQWGSVVDSAKSWAQDKAMWLMEELLTGSCDRARRTPRDGVVELEPEAWTAQPHTEYFVSAVPVHDSGFLGLERRTGDVALHVFSPDPATPPASLGSRQPGSRLAAVGLDVSLPRQRVEERRLICWLEAYGNNVTASPVVGHAAASWDDDRPATALIEVLQVQDGIPAWVPRHLALVRFLVGRASGALRVVTALEDPVFLELGFHRTPGGGLVRETIDTMSGLRAVPGRPPQAPAPGS